jgi:hypothetical protein
MPWRSLPWPRRHELAFVEPPQRLATGDDFEVTLVDRRGTPPDEVQFVLREFTHRGWRTETRVMKPLGRDRLVFRLEHVTHGFAYRAFGGDDNTMPWVDLAVVEPPKLTNLEILVEPPGYTRLPERSEGRLVKALAGSRLVVRGQFDKPIRAVALDVEPADVAVPGAKIAPGGRSFTIGGEVPWIIERSAVYMPQMTDAQGVDFGREARIEVHVVPDAPPSIAWQRPGDHSFVTPRALVPIQGTIKDDLAVRAIQLRYLRPGKSEEEQIIELFSAAEPAPNDRGKAERETTRGPLPFEGDSRSLDTGFDLASLAGLGPGDVLAVRITAEDFKPQLATTTVRRLTIITEDELENRLATRQEAILNQLAEALRLARQGREQTEAVEARLAASAQLAAGDVNQLQAVEHNGRHVGRLLADTAEGAEGQIRDLLDELAANQAADQPLGDRLRELLSGIERLNQEAVPAIEQHLTAALKAASEANPAGGPAEPAPSDPEAAGRIAPALKAAGEQQDVVIHSLEAIVGALTQWDNLSRVAREVAQIRGDQQRLLTETDELRLKSVAASGEASAADLAAANQMARRQVELGRRLDKLQQRMDETLARIGDDPQAAVALAEARDTARRLAIGGQMREAASRLAQRQLGEARTSEQAVLDSLQQLLDALSMRRDFELARRATSLRQATAELKQLARRGGQLAADAGGAAAERQRAAQRRRLERLRRELDELAAESRQLARRLERLSARRAAAPLGESANRAQAAGQAASAGAASAAEAPARDAQQRLEEAQVELANELAQVEEQLAREQALRAEQQLAGLIDRQNNVVAETERLEGVRDAEGALPQLHRGTLANLAGEQTLLADEVDHLRRAIAGAAFDFAFDRASSPMHRAGAALGRGDTSSTVQQMERDALARLQQILAALAPDKTSPQESAAQPPAEGQPPAPPREPAAAIAELKLLKSLQETINRQTTELQQQREQSADWTDEQQQTLDALVREEGRLADLVLEFIAKSSEKPEDHPERAPPKADAAKPDATGKQPASGLPAGSLDAELLRELEK